MESEICAFFVYGTLKRGQVNHPLLAPHALTVEPATTRGLLFDHGPFPALVEGEGIVRGELATVVPDAVATVLPTIDHLEDYRPDDLAGSMYLRRVVTVTKDDGTAVPAYAYFYNRDPGHLRPILSGDWTGPTVAPAPGDDDELAAFKAHVRGLAPRS